MRWVHYILLFTIGLLLIGCEGASNQKKALADFLPENTHKVLKIKQWETTLNDFRQNSVLEQFEQESFADLFKTHQPFFNSLNFSNTVLLASEKANDSIPVFTLISEVNQGLAPLDSITKSTHKEIPFETWTLHQFQIEEQSYYQVITDSMLLLSNSEKNLQELLRSEKKVDSSFQKAFKVKNPESLVYVSRLPQDPSSFAAATAFELKLMADGVAANGVVLDDDPSTQWITLFKGQIPQPIEGQTIIPTTAQKTTIITLSDLSVFESSLQAFNKDSLLTLHPYFETATEIVQINADNGEAFAVKSLDVDLARESLLSVITEKETYREVPVFRMADSISLFKNFEPIFESFSPKEAFIWEDFMVFTQGEAQTQSFITQLKNQNTLANNVAYQQSNPELAKAASYMELSFKGEKASLFNALFQTEATSLKGIPLTVSQLIYDRNFAHLNLVAKEVSEVETTTGNTIQEIASVTLDNPILFGPVFFSNHRTSGKDVVVQDISNQLYFIAASGKILWKKQLDGPILGTINEVDLLRNGRKQLAFATPNTVYALDRNGNTVKPFPKKFNDKITQPLAVFDYDNNRKYRFLVTQGANVYMYDKQLKIVKGFTLKKTNSALAQIPQHIRIGNKDYLVFAEENGKLNLLSRTGKERIKINQSFAFGNIPVEKEGSNFVVISGKSKISIDQKGKINKQDLPVSDNYWFTVYGTTKATLDDNLLRINGQLVELPLGIYTAPQLFSVKRKTYITVTETQENQLFVYDKSASLLANFPVYGSGKAALGDANNNKKLNITVRGAENEVLIYQLH